MRPLGDIDALVESIRELGLLNPISVTRDRRLFSGLHRLAAFKALGRHMIPAVVIDVTRDEAKLREIDENLARNDLTLLERAEHRCHRKEIYEHLHPETRRGGDRGNQHVGGKSRLNDKLSFSHSAATSTGRSSRTVHRLVRIANNLTPKTRKLLRGTDLADNQRALLRLCKFPPDMQESVARKVAGGESVLPLPPSCWDGSSSELILTGSTSRPRDGGSRKWQRFPDDLECWIKKTKPIQVQTTRPTKPVAMNSSSGSDS
jgi:ParB family transcriptional regulator, chromosome partitioning protein